MLVSRQIRPVPWSSIRVRCAVVPNLSTSWMWVVLETPYQWRLSTRKYDASQSVSRAVFAITDLFTSRMQKRSHRA